MHSVITKGGAWERIVAVAFSHELHDSMEQPAL